MRGAVTFDFHNTLIHCDPWFELEVRTLPVRVYQQVDPTGDAHPSDLVATYRAIRAEVISHGNELDAVAGTMETFRRSGINVDPIRIEPIVDQLFADLVVESDIVEGAAELIRKLHDAGFPLGVVSSAVHHDFLDWTLQHHGLADYFETISSSASTGFYKSNPEIYGIALRSLNANAARTVHIGDSWRFDHLSGKQAGLATIWLDSHGAQPDVTAVQPDLSVSSFADVQAIIAFVESHRARDYAN